VVHSVQIEARIDLDREYVSALRDNATWDDPRFSLEYCKDWLPDVHAQQLERLTQRSQRGPIPN
jgi:hypothetical protein